MRLKQMLLKLMADNFSVEKNKAKIVAALRYHDSQIESNQIVTFGFIEQFPAIILVVGVGQKSGGVNWVSLGVKSVGCVLCRCVVISFLKYFYKLYNRKIYGNVTRPPNMKRRNRQIVMKFCPGLRKIYKSISFSHKSYELDRMISLNVTRQQV